MASLLINTYSCWLNSSRIRNIICFPYWLLFKNVLLILCWSNILSQLYKSTCSQCERKKCNGVKLSDSHKCLDNVRQKYSVSFSDYKTLSPFSNTEKAGPSGPAFSIQLRKTISMHQLLPGRQKQAEHQIQDEYHQSCC